MQSKKLKQKDLADAACIGQSAISNYLSGARIPGSMELFRLAKALNVSMEYLISEDAISVLPAVTEEDQTPYGIGASGTWRARALQAEQQLSFVANELTALAKKISS